MLRTPLFFVSFFFFWPFLSTAFFLDLSQSSSQATGPKCVVSNNISSEPEEPSLRRALSSCWLHGQRQEGFPTPKQQQKKRWWKWICTSKLRESQKWTMLLHMTGLAKGASTFKAARRWEALGCMGRGRTRDGHPSVPPFQRYFFLPLHSDIDKVLWPSVQSYWRGINGFIYCSFSESFVIID